MSAPEFIEPAHHDEPEPWPRRHTSLIDSLEGFTTEKPRGICRVGVWENRLTADEMDLLRPHLKHGSIRPLFDRLRHDGVDLPFSATSWERHWTTPRRCSCDTGVGRAAA
jgi:hypothetical protein